MKRQTAILRPMPPAEALDLSDRFIPAPEVWDWIDKTFLAEGAPLRNPDHAHLAFARIGVLWTNVQNRKRMRLVLGAAEMPAIRGDAWVKARQKRQIMDWFGALPDFLLTFAAGYAYGCSDLEWCALVEHELYHCAQAVDEFGAPKFTRYGEPKFAIRGHDVEEFVGVVRRYGVVGEDVRALVDAASKRPEVGTIDLRRACGTCLVAA